MRSRKLLTCERIRAGRVGLDLHLDNLPYFATQSKHGWLWETKQAAYCIRFYDVGRNLPMQLPVRSGQRLPIGTRKRAPDRRSKA